MSEPVAVVVADGDGVIVAWAGHASEWFGHAEADVLGREVDLLVPDEFRSAHRAGVERAMSGGDRHLVGAATHLPVRHAGGTVVVHPARFHHLTTPSGDLVGAAAVFGPANPTAEAWRPITDPE